MTTEPRLTTTVCEADGFEGYPDTPSTSQPAEPRSTTTVIEPESDAVLFSLTPYERETGINLSDGDDVVRIWTAQRTVITALRKKSDLVTEVANGFEGRSPWAEFTVPAEHFNIAGAIRRKPVLSAQERQARADLMRANRTKVAP